MASRFGVSDPKKMEGKSDFDFFTDEHARPAYEQEREIIRTERPIIDLEEKETYIDGRIAWVSTSKMPLHNEYGQVVGTFGVSRDITGRKQTEAALAQAQRSLIETSRLAGMAEVASGVLHNIGNAFNSVNTSVTLLADQTTRLKTVNFARAVALLQEHAHELPRFLTEDPRGRQLPTYFEQLSAQFTQDHQNLTTEIKSLLRGVEHIKGVIAMQQNYTRASTMLEDLSPAELMKEALGITDAANNRHQIEVINEWGAVPNVRAARHRVLEILVNLISNAKHAVVDAGRSERKIWLLIRSGGADRVQFVVADNGVGIKPENLQRIFSFGFTTRSKGHGFGLHSSAVAAQDMDGSLKAFSEGLGHGAQFILELPASPAAGNV
jgi:PAS domain S-box-containing protein